MPKKIPVKDVTEYIQNQVPAAQVLLKALRRLIQQQVPTAEEKILYGQPFYLYQDKRIALAAYKAHVSITFSLDLPPEIIAQAEPEYSTGQKRINITFGQPVPTNLIKATINYLKENQSVSHL